MHTFHLDLYIQKKNFFLSRFILITSKMINI